MKTAKSFKIWVWFGYGEVLNASVNDSECPTQKIIITEHVPSVADATARGSPVWVSPARRKGGIRAIPPPQPAEATCPRRYCFPSHSQASGSGSGDHDGLAASAPEVRRHQRARKLYPSTDDYFLRAVPFTTAALPFGFVLVHNRSRTSPASMRCLMGRYTCPRTGRRHSPPRWPPSLHTRRTWVGGSCCQLALRFRTSDSRWGFQLTIGFSYQLQDMYLNLYSYVFYIVL
jgi:hypothetical protein